MGLRGGHHPRLNNSFGWPRALLACHPPTAARWLTPPPRSPRILLILLLLVALFAYIHDLPPVPELRRQWEALCAHLEGGA